MTDIHITGGTLVDGTGAPARQADIAIEGGTVTAVAEPGGLDGTATRTIDAEGRIVTPGFVDAHTHLDAQIGWDPLATPSCWHGVTSVVIGNCGVTFAPVRGDDRAFLAEMMESVEDIPRDAILDGLPWNWESYGGYLDALDGLDKGVNVAGMVGHCAVRLYAMGERSMEDTAPTDDELRTMVDCVREAIDAGAVGFSSSRTVLHRVPDGRVVPGTHAGLEELLPLVGVLGDAGRGVFSTAACIGEQNGAGPEQSAAEVALFGELSRTSGRPVTFGLTHTWGAGDLYRRVLGFVDDENGRGARIRPQTTCRSIGVLFTIAGRTPFDRAPGWRALRDLPVDARLAVLRDPERRDALVAEADALDGVDATRLFVLEGPVARYDLDPATSLAAHAERSGTSAAAAFVDLVLRTDGAVVLTLPFLNQSLDAVADMLSDDNVMMGLADAGAHVGQIMDASQATHVLSRWVRDTGFWSIEEGVRRITSDTAATFGLADRGVVREGSAADLNVIDLDALSLPLPAFVRDLPNGAGRFVQKADGYVATIVNGTVVIEDGEHTGALPGRVLRPA